MAYNAYVKSLFWLVSIGGAGYGLLHLTKPSEEKLERIKASSSRTRLTEAEQKKVLFMKQLQEAAAGGAQPIYLKKKDDQ